MSKKIVIRKVGRGIYGNEYSATAFSDGKIVDKTVMLGGDIRYANRAFTKDFENAQIVRRYKRKK